MNAIDSLDHITFFLKDCRYMFIDIRQKIYMYGL